MNIIEIDNPIVPTSFHKTAHEITQWYIETYGANFNNIDDLDKMIEKKLKEFYWAGRNDEFIDELDI